MITKLLKLGIDLIDYIIAGQVPSSLGYGHQINRKSGLDSNNYFIIDYIRSLNTPVKILELAAGRGTMAVEISQLPVVESYLASDIDEKALKNFSKRIKKLKNNKITLHQMNALTPDIKEFEHFDIIITDKFIHLLSPEEVETLFETAFQLLKPDGILFISSASTTNLVYKRTYPGLKHSLYRKLKQDILTQLWYNLKKPYVLFITEDYISETALKKGFKLNKNLICPNKDNYLTLGLCKTTD